MTVNPFHAGKRVMAVVAFAGALSVATAAVAVPQIGAAAPGFEGKATGGETIDLEALKGKTVVLEWTNHECPYVRKHYETNNMQALQAEAEEKGVYWISIISSAPDHQGYVTADEADRLTESRDAHPSVVVLDTDGKIGRLYGARATPHMFVIDPNGTLAYMGAIDDNSSSRHRTVESARNYVREAMNAVLEGRDVETTQTRAYGCAVKYGS